jgi:uncharacterized protein
MSTHEFSFSASDLDAGGKEFSFEIRPSWMLGALEDHEAKPGTNAGKLLVRASKSGHDVVVRGTLDAQLSVPCARCLEAFSLPIHSDLSVLFVPRSSLKAALGAGTDEGTDLLAEEADTLPFDGETVVLDDLVHDELVLEVPMIPLCSDDCAGMSTAPGSNPSTTSDKAVDPRLMPLMQFRAKTSKDE